MCTEREENFIRILVAVVSGIILSVWKTLIQVLALFHFFYVLINGERLKNLSDFSEIWNSQAYKFLRYMTYVTNERPFPFTPLGKNLSKYNKKLNKKLF